MTAPAFVETLVGALAFERVAEALAADVPGAPTIPATPELRTAVAVAAASALHRTPDGRGDLYSQRTGPTAVGLLFGLSPETLLHHRLGSRAAPSRGRAAGAFPADLERGLIGPVERPGKGMEVAAGAGMALRLRGESRVVLHVDDVEGTASGDWHEGFNFSAVSRAPVVVVVHSRASGNAPHSALQRLAAKGPGYGVSTATARADVPTEVLEAVRTAVDSARAGGGTFLVEVLHTAPDSAADLAVALGMARGELEARIVARVEEFGPLAAAVRDARLPEDAGSGLLEAPAPWYRTPELRPR